MNVGMLKTKSRKCYLFQIELVYLKSLTIITMISKHKSISNYFISLRITMLVLAWLHTLWNCNIVSTSSQIQNATLPL